MPRYINVGISILWLAILAHINILWLAMLMCISWETVNVNTTKKDKKQQTTILPQLLEGG